MIPSNPALELLQKQTPKGVRTLVTADQHYSHRTILIYQERPWPTVPDMDEGLAANHNAVVRPNDRIIHVGDFCFGKADDFIALCRKLNGIHFFMDGSHDRALAEYYYLEKKPEDLLARVHILPKMIEMRWQGTKLCIQHYAQARWICSHHGAVHLHGHSHGNFHGEGRLLDVGVDCQNFFPIEIGAAIALAKAKAPVENHPKRSR